MTNSSGYSKLRRRRIILGVLGVPLASIGRAAWSVDNIVATGELTNIQDIETEYNRLTGVIKGIKDCEILDSVGKLISYRGSAGRAYLRRGKGGVRGGTRLYVRASGGNGEKGKVCDGLGREWVPDPRELVDIRRFGATEGQDVSGLLNRILATEKILIWIPPALRVLALDVPLDSNASIIIDGAVSMPPSSPSKATIFSNSNVARGNEQILIAGRGELNGLRNAQLETAQHELLRFSNCSSITIDLAAAGGNRFGPGDPSHSGAAIHILGGYNHSVSVGALSDYGREGIWIYDASNCTVSETNTFGGAESWSGVQVGGPSSARNKIINVSSYLAGASGIGCDSKDSLVADCQSHSNAYFHGFNFGHARQPANGGLGIRLKSTSAGTKGTEKKSDFNGFSVVNGSKEMSLVDCSAYAAFRNGFNVSAGADRCTFYRCVAVGSGAYGLNVRDASVTTIACDFGRNTLGAVSSKS
jgi:hypothetical protein